MSKVKVILNRDAVRDQLLKSQELADICVEHAKRIASNAGDGYSYDLYVGDNRVMASAYTATEEAKQDNMDNQTLLKAMG